MFIDPFNSVKIHHIQLETLNIQQMNTIIITKKY